MLLLLGLREFYWANLLLSEHVYLGETTNLPTEDHLITPERLRLRLKAIACRNELGRAGAEDWLVAARVLQGRWRWGLLSYTDYRRLHLYFVAGGHWPYFR